MRFWDLLASNGTFKFVHWKIVQGGSFITFDSLLDLNLYLIRT